jgi:hypothetical protein
MTQSLHHNVHCHHHHYHHHDHNRYRLPSPVLSSSLCPPLFTLQVASLISLHLSLQYLGNGKNFEALQSTIFSILLLSPSHAQYFQWSALSHHHC